MDPGLFDDSSYTNESIHAMDDRTAHSEQQHSFCLLAFARSKSADFLSMRALNTSGQFGRYLIELSLK